MIVNRLFKEPNKYECMVLYRHFYFKVTYITENASFPIDKHLPNGPVSKLVEATVVKDSVELWTFLIKELLTVRNYNFFKQAARCEKAKETEGKKIR